MQANFDRDEFHDFVAAHGLGAPTDEGYKLGAELMATGDDIATAAAEVVARDLITDNGPAPR